MINREAFERARHETDFIAEADYLSLDVVDAARDFVEDKISEYELNSAFARMEGKTKAIAGAAPARIRDRYLPRVESIFRSMDESIREIKKLKAEGKTDDALAVVDVDLADRSVALSRMKDMALVETYIDLLGGREVATRGGSFTQATRKMQAEAGILRCQYCGAPYLYRENLELHERGCPRRGR